MKRSLFLFAITVVTFVGLFLLLATLGTPAAAAPAAPTASLALQVNYAHDWVAGNITPSATVVLTLTDDVGAFKNSASVTADGAGDFFADCSVWAGGECPQIDVGDTVSASVPGVTGTVGPLGSIDGDLDDANDLVTGTLNVPDLAGTLDVRCEVWVESGPPGIDTTADASGGTFTCDFTTVGWDLAPGQDVALIYFEPDGDSVINVLGFPWMRVNYGHDWAEGDYEAGHTVWITVADSGGTTKATAEVESVPGGGWNGDGFQTPPEQWSPAQPDIMPGDVVHFRADDGYTNAVEVGTINGNLDIGNDRIDGTILAPWFTETLRVECHAWVPFPVNSREDTAEPDGSTSYLCDWSGEWDIEPGQTVAAMYVEPDTDRVINTFQEPAPDLRVEKWAEGNGQVLPGAPAVFNLRVSNDGDATAASLTLTDTLPANTAYLSDTSGVAPATGAGWLAWTLGPLDAGEELQFRLALSSSASAGETLHNEADVATQYDFNPDNNHAEVDVQVVDEVPDLYVDKNPDPGDPTPGQTMIWYINYGNNGPAGSGPVTLTDTLPAGTSVVDWYSQQGYPFWNEVSSNGELVLEAPTLPGQWGDTLILQLQVAGTVELGTPLTNTVAISTAGDANPEDNVHENYAWVSPPRWDGSVNKGTGWATLWPGGQIQYHIGVHNGGNMPAHFWLTDTLPAGTTFAEATIWTGSTEVAFPPDYVDGDLVYWDIGILEPGEGLDIQLRLDIEESTLPGTSLINCAEIAIDGDDNYPYDNEACVEDAVRAAGPNLRLRKEAQWEGTDQIRFDVYFENVGNTTLHDVVLTDTLPADTTFTGNWWHWFWYEIQFSDQGDELVWTISQIDPGESAGLSFQVAVAGGKAGQPGYAFTNVVTAPVPDDVYPADNTAQVTAASGPALYIDKVHSGGLPGPGELITFTVEFGNANDWPWTTGPDSTLTDTLPVGMTFITATAPWNPDESWMPDVQTGNVLVWNWGELCPYCTMYFEIVVQLDETLAAGQILDNQIEIRSDDPADVEADYGDNVDTASVTILAPALAIDKAYAGSAVAGTPVTYTLTVTNEGTLAAGNLLITDSLPANLTWLSGGSHDTGSGLISWTAPTLAAGATMDASFSGELACSGSVVNDQYGVTADGDVGATGTPVNLAIQAPTIAAGFSQSADTIEEGGTVIFTSTSTTNGGPLVSWSWDFGDGDGGSGDSASHTYTEPGNYEVSLTVTDGCGYSETVTATVVVEETEYLLYLPVIMRP